MIHRHAILCALTILTLCLARATTSQAADEPLDLSRLVVLDVAEIKDLLTDNTASGDWENITYRQLFRSDGSTIFAQQGARSTVGKWRLNAKFNAYESWWDSTGWTSYTIGRIGERLFWLSKALPPQEFVMLPGEQLVP